MKEKERKKKKKRMTIIIINRAYKICKHSFQLIYEFDLKIMNTI